MSSEKPIKLARDTDVLEIPSGARKKLPAGAVVRMLQSRGGSYTVTAADTGGMYRIEEKDADALGISPVASTPSAVTGPLTDKVIADHLRTIFDPEIPVNIVDLGLVYSCVTSPLESGGNLIDVKMTMTAPGCGMSDVLKADVESKLSRLPQVSEVRVSIVFDPPWNPGLMSEAARLQLGFDTEAEGSSPFPIFRPST
jgi:probable FeS assembly SUF system protein SufT